MTLMEPETTDVFARQRYVVLASMPADLEAITVAEMAAGENISCHLFGDWWATAETEGVTRVRKACSTQAPQGKGTTTWSTPALNYSYNPQTIDTPSSAGNEAYEALPSDDQVVLVKMIGVDSKASASTAGEGYIAYPLDLGPQVESPSSDDAGAEAQITQAAFLQAGYSSPVRGVVAA
jgi:hypothetical protein